jgi:hypothetical protein
MVKDSVFKSHLQVWLGFLRDPKHTDTEKVDIVTKLLTLWEQELNEKRK